MTDEQEISFDGKRIRELMADYRDASSRQERREIEEKVLEETVWSGPELEPWEFVVTRRELEGLIENAIKAVEEGNQEQIDLLRRNPTFWDVQRSERGR